MFAFLPASSIYRWLIKLNVVSFFFEETASAWRSTLSDKRGGSFHHSCLSSVSFSMSLFPHELNVYRCLMYTSFNHVVVPPLKEQNNKAKMSIDITWCIRVVNVSGLKLFIRLFPCFYSCISLCLCILYDGWEQKQVIFVTHKNRCCGFCRHVLFLPGKKCSYHSAVCVLNSLII